MGSRGSTGLGAATTRRVAPCAPSRWTCWGLRCSSCKLHFGAMALTGERRPSALTPPPAPGIDPPPTKAAHSSTRVFFLLPQHHSCSVTAPCLASHRGAGKSRKSHLTHFFIGSYAVPRPFCHAATCPHVSPPRPPPNLASRSYDGCSRCMPTGYFTSIVSRGTSSSHYDSSATPTAKTPSCTSRSHQLRHSLRRHPLPEPNRS